MTLLNLIANLAVIGIALWMVNAPLSRYIQPPIVKLINMVTVLVVVIWLLSVFGIISTVNSIPVPRLR